MPRSKPQIPYTILIVEDELAIAENLMLTLETEGFIVDTARDANAALDKLAQQVPDLMLLDIGLPGINGYELLRQIRADMQLPIPVLILTARASLEDKSLGFSIGADDFISKPFNLEEVVMRVRALIRRSKQLSETVYILRYGPLEYSIANQTVTVNGEVVKLSKKGLMLLELLMRYGGRVVPRQRFEDYLWQGEPPSTEALRSQLHLLRKALMTKGYDGIETVHNIGWRLTKPDMQQ